MTSSRFALAPWLTALTLVWGCSSPEQAADRTARTALSWAASVRLTSEALARGAVPRVYATQVLQAAQETKRQLSRQPEWRSLPPDVRGQLEESIRKLSAAMSERPDSSPPP